MIFRRSSELIFGQRGVLRNVLAWVILAGVLWFGAGALDRTTSIAVFSDGGKIHVEVAGTTLSAPLGQHRLSAVEIRASDSIAPPGGVRIEITTDTGTTLDQPLPARFQFPQIGLTPIGDWELDERVSTGTVWRHEAKCDGPYSLEASFRGRFLRDLELILEGEPTITVAVRRGLINNDCFIRDDTGWTVAATTLDPTPVRDLGAIVAALLRAAAIAALLISAFCALWARSRPHPLPAAAMRWNSRPIAAALIIAAAGLSVWVAFGVLEGLPHMPDSVVYLLQAHWILDGSLWSQVSDFQEYLTVPYTYVDHGRWLAHYPPGWPFILAFGLAAGAPWLVAPMLGAVFLLVLYLTGREIGGDYLGLVAATLGLISPITRLLFASMLSHAATATLILTAIYLTLIARRRGRWAVAAAAGAAIGLSFGIRPLTAMAVAIPLGVTLSLDLIRSRQDRRAFRRFAGWLGGFVVATVPTLIANTLITGNALAFPYSFASGSMYFSANIPFGIRNLDALLASFGAGVFGWGWSLLHGQLMGAVAMAFALVPFMSRRWRSNDVLMAAIIVSVLLAHLGTRGHGMHGFGPRYYFEVFAPFFLLTARGFQELGRARSDPDTTERRAAVVASMGLFVALCLPAGAILPQRMALYRGYNGVDGSLARQIEEVDIGPAVVILPPDEWQGWAMASPMMDFDPDSRLLFIQARHDDPAIEQIANGRNIFVWRNGRLVHTSELSVVSTESPVISDQ